MSLTKCSTRKPGAIQRPIQVESRAVSIEQRFADTDHVGRDQDLVDRLRMLPRAGRALVQDRLAHHLEARHDGCDRIGVATDHDRQSCFARTDIAAGHRRVQRADRLEPRPLGDLPRERRLAGRHVHEDRTGARPCEHSLLPEQRLAHIPGKAHDRKDDLARFRHHPRRIGPRCAGLQQRFGLRPRATINGHRITGLHQVAAHRRAHHARADPAESRLARLSHLKIRHACLSMKKMKNERQTHGVPSVVHSPWHSDEAGVLRRGLFLPRRARRLERRSTEPS